MDKAKKAYSEVSAFLNLIREEEKNMIPKDILQKFDSCRDNKNLSESMEAKNLEMIGKDLSRLENLINQLEIVRNKELEEEEKLLKESQTNIAQDLLDKVENILEDSNQNENLLYNETRENVIVMEEN